MSIIFNRFFNNFNFTKYRSICKSWTHNYCEVKIRCSEEEIVSILQKKFPKAVDIQVRDTSGGCGQMFSILVESEDFKNLSVLKQHKIVYETLDEQIKIMHGIHLVTKPTK